MKKMIKTVALIALSFFMNTVVNAQKLAHINVDSLLTMMPETKEAQEIAQTYAKQLEKEITSMQVELDAKYKAYLAEEPTLSDLLKQKKQEELQSLQQRIEEFRAQAQQDYQKKYSELSKPIYDKAKKAITDVAKENGFKFVFDTSAGFVVYSEPTDDILVIVKKKLDSMPKAVLPGAGSNNNGTTPPKNNTPPNNKPGNTKPGGK